MTFRVPIRLRRWPSSLRAITTYNPELLFTAGDLAWALFVTGRAPGDEGGHGVSSLWEFLHRAAVVPAYVRRDAQSRLAKSNLATELDRSEKVNLSYTLGQAMAAISTQQLFGVRRLLHVDRYSARHGVSFGPGRERPDLFGLGRNGQWIVVEAKGRSGGIERQLVNKVAQQKSAITDINGSPPVAIGVIAAFPTPNRTMRVVAVDPPEMSSDAGTWTVSPDLIAAAYYSPFVELLAEADRRSGPESDQVLMVDLGPVGVQIGLLRSIVDLLLEASSRSQYDGLARSIDEAIETSNAAIRPDGSVFTASWEQALRAEDYG